MKKRIIISALTVFGVVVVLLCVVSCASDYIPVGNNASQTITLAAATETGGTRAATNIQSSSFYENEVINAYITDADGNAIGDSPAKYKTGKATDNINPLTPFGEQPYFPNGPMTGDDAVKIDVRAIYPQSVTDPEEGETVQFPVSDNQTDSASYKASDLMFASVKGHGKRDGTAMLRFQHKMAKMVVTATGQDGIRVVGIRLQNMSNAVEFNTATGEATTIDVDGTKPDIFIENGGAALIPPQPISGIFLTVDVERDVTDGEETKTETSTASFNLQTAKVLEAGKQYNINVAIGVQNLSTAANIPSWPASVGTISVAAAGSVGFYITGVENKVYTRDSITQENLKVYTTYDEATGTYSNPLTAEDYTLQYFNNLNTGAASVLVLGAGTYTGLASVKSFEITKAPCALKYDPTTVSTDFAYESVVDNPLKLLHGGTGGAEYDWRASDGTLSFEYDNSIAHVDDYGNVTMRGVGTTTIKATLNGDGNYQPATTSYSLTIKNKELLDPTTHPESTIKLEFPASYEYTGSSLQSTFEAGGETGLVVKDGNGTLIRGTHGNTGCHYSLTYYRNGAVTTDLTNVGTITVVIQGENDYTGSITISFQITMIEPELNFDETPVILDVSHDNRTHVPGTFSTGQYLFESSITRTASATYGANQSLTPTLSISGNTGLVSFTSSTGRVVANQVTDTQSATTDAYKNYVKGTVTVTATVGDDKNTKKITKSYTITLVQTVWDFYFNGAASEAAANSYFTSATSAVSTTIPGQIVPWQSKATGTYGLEAWGAQGGGYGGSGDRYGGAGGYTYGQTDLTNETLYVVCGGGGRWKLVGATPDPNRTNRNAGGYNGGGSGGNSTSYHHSGGGGGGATHIAKVTGLLHAILDADNDNVMDANAANSLYIVAGGGGGNTNARTAGNGGGESGGWGTDFVTVNTYGNVVPGGTQTTGYSPGLGQDGATSFVSSGNNDPAQSATDTGQQSRGNPGGGGGYWGGYAKTSSNTFSGYYSATTYAGAGGGSGYVNTNVMRSSKTSNGGGFELTPTAVLSTSGYSPSPTGQGHARITLLTVPTSARK